MFKFFQAQYNPQDLTGTVGGSISTLELSGYLGELFTYTVAPPEEYTGAYYQYRKIFVMNDYESSSSNTRLWLDAQQHPDQISIAVQTGGTPTVANASTEPNGITTWAQPSNFSEGVEIGTMTSSSYTGVWLRQKLSEVTEADPYSSLRIYIGGIIN